MNTGINWHARFRQQAGWTRALRQYLFKQAGLQEDSRILEVGCGSGAILAEVPNKAGNQVFGMDIDPVMIRQAAENAPLSMLSISDAHKLPFPSRIFQITFCHYLLLWVASPLEVLEEMERVTREGGVVMVMAEPDYSKRRDDPESMRELGILQTTSLIDQGADVNMGSKLGDLFEKAGINLVETGWLENQKLVEHSNEKNDLEWQVMESDLRGNIPHEQLEIFRKLDIEARRNGSRRIHIPTAFAWGTV
jgi:SAM-dependent methyltransferase